jgi:hypothetical protein
MTALFSSFLYYGAIYSSIYLKIYKSVLQNLDSMLISSLAGVWWPAVCRATVSCTCVPCGLIELPAGHRFYGKSYSELCFFSSSRPIQVRFSVVSAALMVN